MFEPDPVISQPYRKRGAERQNGIKQVLLIERDATSDHPIVRIILREKNIVNVHPDTSLELRQYVEEFRAHVTPDTGDMARIDKQDIILTKLGEAGGVEILYVSLNEGKLRL